MKSCTNPDCEQTNPQPIENFYKKKKTRQSRCRVCVRASSKVQHAENTRLIQAKKLARNAHGGHE